MELRINQYLVTNIEIPLSKVIGLTAKWEVNEHGCLRLKGEIPYEAALKSPNQLFLKSPIELKINWQGEEKVLFNGLVKNYEITFEGRSAQICVEGITATWKLDIERKKRSFQDTEMIYADISKEIAVKQGANIIITCGNSMKILKPLIQYMETDWEFVKRIASHLGKSVISDLLTGKPAFWLGMRQGIEIPIFFKNSYEMMIELESSQQSYIVKSKEVYQIGDKTVFQGKTLVIYKRIIEFDRGEMLFTYTLSEESAIRQNVIYNEDLTGRELYGIVEQVVGENVAVQLEIDGDEKNGAYLYPWRPETGNMMYAMPEKGSPVLLTMPSYDEREAVVKVCLHRDGAENNYGKHYQNRIMQTSDSAKIKLYPCILEMSKKENKLVLEDEAGIYIGSGKKIEIEAKEKVRLKAERIDLKASDEIKGIIG